MNTALVIRFIKFVTTRSLTDANELAGGIVGTVLFRWDELPPNLQAEIEECFTEVGA